MIENCEMLIHENETKLIIKCYHCENTFEVIIENDKFTKYRNGELSANEAFIDLSDDDYELLIGGICSDCLDVIFYNT